LKQIIDEAKPIDEQPPMISSVFIQYAEADYSFLVQSIFAAIMQKLNEMLQPALEHAQKDDVNIEKAPSLWRLLEPTPHWNQHSVSGIIVHFFIHTATQSKTKIKNTSKPPFQ